MTKMSFFSSVGHNIKEKGRGNDMKKDKKMRLGISFFGVMMIASLFLSHSYIALAALLAAFLHELSHILAAKLLGVSLTHLRLDIFGAAIGIEGEISSYKKEALVALAGPLCNLISVLLLLPFSSVEGTPIYLFISASLFLGLLNLLPIKDLDGGRVLFCILAFLLSLKLASRVLSTLSFLVILSLWTLSVYLLLRLGASLSLFIFSASLFCKIFIGKEGTA